MLRKICGVLLGCVLLPAVVLAQNATPAPSASHRYVPPTAGDRLKWVVEGTASLPILGVNAADSAWSTKIDRPREWGGGAKGFARRFGDEEASATVEDTIEASVGAIWSEDPRYRRSGHKNPVRRVEHALAATVVAPRRDGHLAPAWARFSAIAATVPIENTWLPPSVRTKGQVAWRVGDDLIGRALSNVWDEFWPDIRRWLPAAIQ